MASGFLRIHLFRLGHGDENVRAGGGEEKEKRRRKKKKNAERPCRSYKVISLTWPATDRLSTKLFLLFEQGGEEKEATLEYATTLVSPMVSKKTDRPR